MDYVKIVMCKKIMIRKNRNMFIVIQLQKLINAQSAEFRQKKHNQDYAELV